MADAVVGRVALFSIHPHFADAILDGSKAVEFRRTPLHPDVTHIVVYATAPVKRIVGSFEVAGVEALSPAEAWERYSSKGCIDQTSFERYYTGASRAYVIKVKYPRPLQSPVPLSDVDAGLRPPQSFQYLTAEVLSRHSDLISGERLRPDKNSKGRRLVRRLLEPVLG